MKQILPNCRLFAGHICLMAVKGLASLIKEKIRHEWFRYDQPCYVFPPTLSHGYTWMSSDTELQGHRDTQQAALITASAKKSSRRRKRGGDYEHACCGVDAEIKWIYLLFPHSGKSLPMHSSRWATIVCAIHRRDNDMNVTGHLSGRSSDLTFNWLFHSQWRLICEICLG